MIGEDGTHHSKEGLPKKRAEAQMKALYIAMRKEKKGGSSFAEDTLNDPNAGPDIPADAMKPKGDNLTMVGGVPLFIYWTICRQTYKLIHGLFPQPRIANPAEGEDDDYRPGANDPGIFKLVAQTPTILFYSNGSICIIGCRGSVTAEDWKANTQIPLNKLLSTDRLQKDIQFISTEQRKLLQQNPHIKFYATGHSLGGAVSDVLVAHNFAILAVTYNPAVEPQYKHSSSNHRIYNEWDPLYAIMGRFANTFQVRRGDKRPNNWLEMFAKLTPWGLIYTKAMGALYAHQLERFMGGGKAKAKNALYGGQQCRTFTQPECENELSGYYDPDTMNCFQDGVNLGEKDCDAPAPPPFNPVPAEPGRPDQPGIPAEFKPGKRPPSGYRPDLKPAEPSTPGIPAEFKPGKRPPSGYRPDLKPNEPSTPGIPAEFKPGKRPPSGYRPDLKPPVEPDPKGVEPWENKPYTTGTIVSYKGLVFKCIKDVPERSPTDPILPTGNFLSKTYWDRITITPSSVTPTNIPGVGPPPKCWNSNPGGEKAVIDEQMKREPLFAGRVRQIKLDIVREVVYSTAQQAGNTVYGRTSGDCYAYIDDNFNWQTSGKNSKDSRGPCFPYDPPSGDASGIWDGNFLNHQIPEAEKTEQSIINRLANKGWLDAQFENALVETWADYAKKIPVWAKKATQGSLGPCKEMDPKEHYDDCVANGYPQFKDETDFRNGLADTYHFVTPAQARAKGLIPNIGNPNTPRGTAPEGTGYFVEGKDYVVLREFLWNPDEAQENISFTADWATSGEYPGVKQTHERANGKKTRLGAPDGWDGNIEFIDFTNPIKELNDEFVKKYGTTFAEFQRLRDDTCSKVRDENEPVTYNDWWDKIGSKYNSPCPTGTLQPGDPNYIYNPGVVDLNTKVCRQWRVDARNLTEMMPPDALDKNGKPKAWAFENRILPQYWATDQFKEHSDNDPGYIDDKGKWVWQHETTTARDATGLDEPPVEGCDFPPLSGTDPQSLRLGPDECFFKQKEWIDLLKQQEEVAQCKDASCFLRPEKLLPWLGDTISGLISNLISSNLPGGAIAQQLTEAFSRADKTSFARGLVKPAFGWLTSQAMNALMNALNKAGDGALHNVFGPTERKQMIDKFNASYPAYTDPLTQKKVPAESEAERQNRLLARRTDPDGPIYSLRAPDQSYDKLGYNNEYLYQPNADTSATAKWRVRGGRKPSFEDKLKNTEMMVRKTIELFAKHGAIKEWVRRAKEKKNSMMRGGARPHHKFEKHLISYGISPDVYLNLARQKAKKAGLQWNHLGFADDEKHKLTIPNEEGHLVSFGSAGMGDHILYSLLKDPKANQHRTSYLARATKIRGDWKKSPYSANSLAIKVLW